MYLSNDLGNCTCPEYKLGNCICPDPKRKMKEKFFVFIHGA